MRFVSSDQLATCGTDGLVRVWKLTDTNTRAFDVDESPAYSIQLSPDGDLLLYTCVTGFGVVNSLNGHVLSWSGKKAALPAVSAWSPTGDRFAVCLSPAFGERLRIYDRTGKRKCAISPASLPRDVAFSPNGRLVAIIGEQSLQICNAESGKEVIRRSLDAEGRAVAFAHKGVQLAFGGVLGRVFICSGPDLWPERELDCKVDTCCIAFSPDDLTLATGHQDGVIRLWDTATGSLRAVLIGHGQALRDIAISPDGRTLISSADDGTVRMWSVQHARSYGVFDRTATLRSDSSADQICGVSLSADGRRLAVGYTTTIKGSPDVRIWDIRDRPED